MGAVYLATAWLLLQVVETVAPILELPGWFPRGMLLLLAVGFPVALVLAWAFELTPSGVQRDDGNAQRPGSRRNPIDYLIVITLGLALAYFVADKYLLSPGRAPALDASVAVLPFTNLSQDPKNDPFVDGLHDDLLTQLFRIRSLRTIPRTSVLQYRNTTKTISEIAADLGVAAILDAGVQRSGNRIRINAQLIDASTATNIWADSYDEQLTATDVFEIQSAIARSIAAELQAALTPDDQRRLDAIPTRNIDALETYFIGRKMLEHRTLESLEAAIEYFETVVELDPGFALAWSGIADGYMLLPEYSATADRKMVDERALAAVTRALALNPDLPEVGATHAWYELRMYDWKNAEKIFRDALAVGPDNTNVLHWLSHVLSWQGKHAEAVALARHAVEVEPESRMMRTNLAYILTDAGLYDEALEIGHQLRREAPEYFALRRNIFLHELRAGRPQLAARTFFDYTVAIGGDADAATVVGDMFVDFAERGEVGDLTDELIALTKLGSEDLAQVLAFVGDAEGTIAALQAAAPEHSGSRSVFSMKINPGYDFIRDDPRFQALLAEVGLAD